MKNWLIGLGGIGCRTLSLYKKKYDSANVQYIFIDVDPSTMKDMDEEDLLLLSNEPMMSGTGAYPEIGANAVLRPDSAIRHKMVAALRKSLSEDPELNIRFITTSFGGFGSGAVLHLASAALRDTRSAVPNADIHIDILAVSEEYFPELMWPSERIMYAGNTKALKDAYYRMREQHLLEPQDVSFYLFTDLSYMEHEEELLALSDGRLRSIAEILTDPNVRNRPLPVLKPYKGDQPYIFVSYAHRDMRKVLPVIRRMTDDGFRVWYDEGIDPGTEWDEIIASHVEKCTMFIAMLSDNYLSSSNCRDELNYARDLEKDRVLIYLSDVKLEGGMRMRLSRLQNIHKYTYEDDNEFFAKLYETKNIGSCRE